MALTVVLLVGASLLIRSFVRLLDVNPGYRTQNAVVLSASLTYDRSPDGSRRRVAFYRDLMAQLRSVPGVRQVGAASGFPLVGGGNDGAFIIMARVDEPLQMSDMPKILKDPTRSGYANFLVVDGSYFDAMAIPVLRCRSFNGGDTPDAPHVGVISVALAKLKWPNESALGKII